MKKMFNIFYTGLVGCALSAAGTSCSDDTYSPDPDKNWAGTTEFFTPTESNAQQTYYNPQIGRCGDPMPFYDQNTGDFKVLYLQEYVNNGPTYHPFWAVATNDGANYRSLGEILPTGSSVMDADAALGTGCAVYSEAEKQYYIYYTGHAFISGSQREVVMRATSPDFKTWTKDYQWTLKGSDYNTTTDFRDPQVFKADDGLWHMVIAGKLKFLDFQSADLKNWEYVGQFNMVWDRMCECPDIFKMGDWWYCQEFPGTEGLLRRPGCPLASGRQGGRARHPCLLCRQDSLQRHRPLHLGMVPHPRGSHPLRQERQRGC